MGNAQNWADLGGSHEIQAIFTRFSWLRDKRGRVNHPSVDAAMKDDSDAARRVTQFRNTTQRPSGGVKQVFRIQIPERFEVLRACRATDFDRDGDEIEPEFAKIRSENFDEFRRISKNYVKFRIACVARYSMGKRAGFKIRETSSGQTKAQQIGQCFASSNDRVGFDQLLTFDGS